VIVALAALFGRGLGAVEEASGASGAALNIMLSCGLSSGAAALAVNTVLDGADRASSHRTGFALRKPRHHFIAAVMDKVGGPAT
jgi:hypothetical protein